jgi:N-acetylmuramoyl-L-alanine amidase
MRSFAKACAVLVVLTAPGLSADLTAQSAETMYTGMLAREAELRDALDLAPQLRAQPPGEASTALLRRVRSTMAAYEAIIGRFPRSGYSDNALWQGGMLAADAFWQFGDTSDRTTALAMFARLKSEYPTSSLIARIAGVSARLNGSPASPDHLTTLKAVRRDVLPGAVRITLELEHEATFYEERLSGPSRVFIDLDNTLAVGALRDATIPFQGDVVQRARIGRQPNNRTRVVFDLQGAGRYSVYSLYNPYRVVVDFERLPAAESPTTMLADTSDAESGLEDTAANAAADTAGAKTSVRLATARETSGTPPLAATANAAGGFSLSRQLGLGISRIVIDPGHGGRDPGAQVRGLNEAELVLDIATRLERLLSKEPGVEVVMTRHTNAYVALEERTAIANRTGADLFLSIHVNAIKNQTVRGFETYFLNFAPNPEAEAVAARENAGSARTMANLPDIVEAIALNNKIDESRDFAAMIQASMQDRLRKADHTVRNLGVKQAPFMVLIGATMPSVLAEVSFLSNRDEAGLLRTQKYRQQIAEALLAGVMQYQHSLKNPPVLRSGL